MSNGRSARSTHDDEAELIDLITTVARKLSKQRKDLLQHPRVKTDRLELHDKRQIQPSILAQVLQRKARKKGSMKT